MINYVFYFNSDGLIYSPTVDSFIGRKKDADHLPSLDGYIPGDKLTVAYEGPCGGHRVTGVPTAIDNHPRRGTSGPA